MIRPFIHVVLVIVAVAFSMAFLDITIGLRCLSLREKLGLAVFLSIGPILAFTWGT